jgi:signal transduction histidine kinase
VPGKKRRQPSQHRGPGRKLQARLEDAEATLAAIRAGQVDALVLSGPGGEQTVTIEGATHPYFVLLDAMSDGAALLHPSGALLFGNRSFRDIVGLPIEALRGSTFQQLVPSAERASFEDFLRAGAVQRQVPRQFTLTSATGASTSTSVSVCTLPLETHGGARATPASETVLMAIVTDLTYRNAAEETRAHLTQRLISAEDDERRRIARELHDEAGQSLTALLVGLRAITDMTLPPAVQPVVLHLRDIALRTVDELARLARGMHPAVLDDQGLEAAARRYVADYGRSHATTVAFTAADLDSPRLTPLSAATIYRILQEALTNVARHAAAKRVAVDITRDDVALGLLVEDDGVGFDVKRIAGISLGLRGMRERAMLLGGSIQIESARGKGTTVRARIPIGAIQ